MKRNTLLATSDYSIFKPNLLNRLAYSGDDVVARTDLVASMRTNGFLPECPIITYAAEDGSLEIVDGHHRYAAAVSLQIPVYYLVLVRPTDRPAVTPVSFSKAQKAWKTNQYIEAYAAEGRPHYRRAIQYAAETGLTSRQAAWVLSGFTANSNEMVRRIPTGDYVAAALDTAERIRPLVAVLRAHRDFAGRSLPDVLLTAILQISYTETCDMARLVKRCATYDYLLHKCVTKDAYMAMLEGVYNRGVRSADHYYLCTEVGKAMAARNIVLATSADRKALVQAKRERMRAVTEQAAQ